MSTLHESAVRLGHLRWLERALFRVLGEAAGHATDADVCVLLAANARAHARHAELLGERLPEVRELNPEAQTAPGSPALADYIEAIDMTDTTAVVDAVYGAVLPALLVAYADHLAGCTPVADANVMRSMQLIEAAERSELGDAARLVTDADAARASWGRVGGIFGE